MNNRSKDGAEMVDIDRERARTDRVRAGDACGKVTLAALRRDSHPMHNSGLVSPIYVTLNHLKLRETHRGL
jgi:hypothetical protein